MSDQTPPLVAEADPASHWDFVVTGVPAANAGDLTAYLTGLGYAKSQGRGELAVAVAGNGTAYVNADRDPTVDLRAYAAPPPPPAIDLVQTVLVALAGSDAQKQAAIANLQAVLAAPASTRRTHIGH